VTCSSEASVGLQRNARRNVPEDGIVLREMKSGEHLPSLSAETSRFCPAALYGPLTLSAGHRLKLFEHKVLRRIQ
jgi:hypothetical protein